jgi:Trk K+ transport system NAD-binding subunit
MGYPASLLRRRTNGARRARFRKLRAGLRDSWLLLRQFGWPLFAFGIAILGGGILYYLLAQKAGEPLSNPVEAVYAVLAMTFLQPIGPFPQAWYLEIFFFLMPVIGIGILAQGVADFGVLFFNRRARGKEWEMAVASTFNNHILLIGLGHLGFRIVRDLHEMDQEVVVVELNPNADLVASVKALGISVIEDDARREITLEAAGVRKARSLLLCTQNDSMNLQIALKARSLNPKIQVVLRIFDDDFAFALQEQFGFTAMSATGMAAPAFAAAAAGVDMTRPITVDGQSLSLARLIVGSRAGLAGLTVGQVEKQYEVSVVLLRHAGLPDLHPASGSSLDPGDELAVLGGPDEITVLIRENLN